MLMQDKLESISARVPVLDVDPYTAASLTDPFPYAAAIREAGRVVWLNGPNVWAMGRHADVQAVLSDWKTFVSGRGTGLADCTKEKPWREPSLLLETDPPLHSKYGTTLAPAISALVIKRLKPMIEERA